MSQHASPLDTEVAGGVLRRFHDIGLDQDLVGRDIHFGDHIHDTVQIASDCRNNDTICFRIGADPASLFAIRIRTEQTLKKLNKVTGTLY